MFVNASLLFAVQPMFTKMVLPLLGGTPSVWNTCLLFFQAALLLGYLYAHLTSRRLEPRAQGFVHLTLLLLALAFLPFRLPGGMAPPAGAGLPVVWLLGILTMSLGLPFVLLAAGAPMFQRWFAATSHPAAGNPYVLYIASNLGSFVALLAYPTLIEPALHVSEQRWWWRVLYWGLLLLVGVAWWMTVRLMRGNDSTGKDLVAAGDDGSVTFQSGGGPPTPLPSASEPPRLAAPPALAPADADAAPALPTIVPTRAWRVRWVLLAFAPSSLLLGVTTYLSTDVAAVPLLWVIPLALYLFTFVLVFAQQPLLGRRFMLVFQLLVALALLLVIGMTPTKLRLAHVALHLIGFFATAMVCHRELADTRPRPEFLTEFYLWMSLGGMLGGLFNVVLAPLLYDRVLEYPFALIIALGLRPVMRRIDTRLRPVLLDLLLPFGLYTAMLLAFRLKVPMGTAGSVAMWSIFGAAALIVASFFARPLRLALGAAAMFLAVDGHGRSQDVVYQERSFFGVYRVHRWGDYLVLQNGTTTHGAQSVRSSERREPLTYYARAGPLGDAFALLTDTVAKREVALVGLGTGTTACYGHPEETWTYYEIDPAMARLARNRRLFTYLRDCGPNDRVILGDARLSLRNASDGAFDLIVLDAFSSDAIPVHLMTREAVQLYLRKLKPAGSILFHVSNRYLDLEPVVAQLARDAHLAGAARDYSPTDDEKEKMLYASRWVALSRQPSILAPLVVDREWRLLQPRDDVRLWTDDYSDVLGVLKRQ